LTSIPIQQPRTGSGDEDETGPEWLSFGAEDQISFMESIHRLPHPTILNALAGASAGALQGLVFAPIENTVRSVVSDYERGCLKLIGYDVDCYNEESHHGQKHSLGSLDSSSPQLGFVLLKTLDYPLLLRKSSSFWDSVKVCAKLGKALDGVLQGIC
jgi:hypothetical protein